MGGIFLRRFGHQTETWTTAFSTGAPGGTSSGWANFTMRQRIPAAQLTDFIGSKGRVTLRTTGSVSINVNKMYVALAGVGNFDFASVPTQAFFNGSASGSAAAGGNDLTSDAFTLAYDGTAAMMISVFFAASPATSLPTYAITGCLNGSKSGDDAITTIASGYSNSAFLDAFRLIEILVP